jgi:serine/threonine-protein kinase
VEQVGRYLILGELGRGAMGVVYKAQDPAIGRIIAIKSIRLNDLTEESERERLRERLFREAQSAGILSHPGIVTIYDIFEEAGLAYIFMEFVNGPAFESMLGAAQTPDKDTLLSILRQIASALDYAHRKGIIHRDIKPANIMIHEDGSAKVTDFGIAKIASQAMTQTGTIMGTPTYMSPEQVQGIPVTGQADQFSLAVMTYEALTGEKPFNGEYLPTLLYKIVREEPIAPTLLNPTLDQQVDGVMRRAMAKAPADRFPSCGEFVEALAEALNAAPGWTPFPRGASHHISTVGSQDKNPEPAIEKHLEETHALQSPPTLVPHPPVRETSVPVPPPPAVPPTSVTPPAPPPSKEPMAATVLLPQGNTVPWTAATQLPPPSESHLFRNVLICAVLVLAGLVGYLAYQRQNAQPTSSAAQAGQPGEASPTTPDTPPLPTPQTIPPPAPQSSAPKPDEQPAPAKPVQTAAATPAAPTAPATGDFQLTTTPAGATAEFDDSTDTTCHTPCTISLSAGRHTFVVTASGYREARRILEIPHDTGLIVNLEHMQGTLHLVSTPSGLPILIDGQEQSSKTPATLQLPPGSHRVEIIKGTDRQGFPVEIHDGSTVTRTVEWQ